VELHRERSSHQTFAMGAAESRSRETVCVLHYD